MHKFIKKFGTFILTIFTLAAFVALPTNAQSYNVTYIPDTQKADENGNTFTPGLTVRGNDEVFDLVKTSGAVRTYTTTLSVSPVYGLSECILTYNNSAHSTESVRFYEYLGIMDVNSTYFLNREKLYVYDNNGKFVLNNETQIIENDEGTECFSVSAAVMLSNSKFTITTQKYCRFPSALGSFSWSKTVTPNEIIGS